MLFECKASFAHPELAARATRAKIGLGGKNGAHFILIGFPSSKEKLSLQSVDKVMLSKNKVSGISHTFVCLYCILSFSLAHYSRS